MSSGRPPAAIAVIRISGADAIGAATSLAGRLPSPRRAAVRALRGSDGDLLDRALVLAFPGPASATGEDLVELHCHGGRAVVEAVENALYALPRVRRAEPGEFTRRALANGRIDLTEAAGLADLLEAETEAQRRVAIAGAEGRVSRAIRGWMDRIATLSARVEASIDYAEDGDVDADAAAMASLAPEQSAIADDIAAVLAAPPVERWRDGLRVVIAGPPNAGKSTLINLLAGRDAAIVSPIAGTTRDRIEVSARRNGVGYVLVDTAGLHDATDDVIERTGMDLAREAVAVADLVLWLGDEEPPRGSRIVRLHGMADLPGRQMLPGGAVLAVSSTDRSSIDRTWELIEAYTGSSIVVGPTPLHEREWVECDRALAALATPLADPVLLAEQLRIARSCLARILGLDATEVMLDALFSRFCLGK